MKISWAVNTEFFKKVGILSKRTFLWAIGIYWLFIGFPNFGLIPVLTILHKIRPDLGLLKFETIVLNWAFLNDVFDIFFVGNPNKGTADSPPPLTKVGLVTLICVSFGITILVIRYFWKEWRLLFDSIKRVSRKRSDY